MLRVAAKTTCAWRHTHDTRTAWSEDGCRGLLQHTRPVSRTSQVPSTIQGYSALTDPAVAPLHQSQNWRAQHGSV